jgi:hypothetical protein
VIQIHLAVDQFLSALEAAQPGKTEEEEVVDFFERQELKQCKSEGLETAIWKFRPSGSAAWE